MGLRETVNALVTIQSQKAKGDLLDPNLTQDHLIALLNRAVAPAAQGGLGYHLLLTSIRSDHDDDSGLGPHGHAHGFAVDIGTINSVDVGDNDQTIQFVRDMIANNRLVTKVGTLRAVTLHPELIRLAADHNTVLFVDKGTGPHVHLQTV